METFLLVIVLMLGDVEQHVAIIIPDEDTCYELRDAFIYAVQYTGVGQKNEQVVPMTVADVRCEIGEN